MCFEEETKLSNLFVIPYSQNSIFESFFIKLGFHLMDMVQWHFLRFTGDAHDALYVCIHHIHAHYRLWAQLETLQTKIHVYDQGY